MDEIKEKVRKQTVRVRFPERIEELRKTSGNLLNHSDRSRHTEFAIQLIELAKELLEHELEDCQK